MKLLALTTQKEQLAIVINLRDSDLQILSNLSAKYKLEILEHNASIAKGDRPYKIERVPSNKLFRGISFQYVNVEGEPMLVFEKAKALLQIARAVSDFRKSIDKQLPYQNEIYTAKKTQAQAFLADHSSVAGEYVVYEAQRLGVTELQAAESIIAASARSDASLFATEKLRQSASSTVLNAGTILEVQNAVIGCRADLKTIKH